MNNPYTSRGPLHDARLFFGRTHELIEIGSFLQGNQSISIVGPRKIGKTSLMLYLMRPETRTSLGLGSENLFVYIDCQAISTSQQNEIFALICTETAAALHSTGLEPEHALKVAVSNPSWTAFEVALRKLNQSGLRVVFMLDEFEQLTMNTNIDVSFYNALRSAAGRLKVVYITGSAQPLIELTYFDREKKILSSPFFNIFAQLFLGLLSKGEAGDLIREPMAAAGAPVSPQLEDFIYQFVGGHPLSLQIACFHALENPQNYQLIEQLTLQELEAHFQYYWHNLNPAERDMLHQAGEIDLQEVDGPSQKVVLHALRRKCLLVEVDGIYQYPSRAWAEFVSAQQNGLVIKTPAESPLQILSGDPLEFIKKINDDWEAHETPASHSRGGMSSIRQVLRESLPEIIGAVVGGIILAILGFIFSKEWDATQTVNSAIGDIGLLWPVLLAIGILAAGLFVLRSVLKHNRIRAGVKKLKKRV